MGVFIWRGLITPKFSVPPSGETMRQTPKRFKGKRTCSRSSITMPSLVAIGFYPPPGRRKTLSFFVCPSRFFCHALCVTLVTSRFWTPEFVRPISPWRRWSTEIMILMPLDRGRFVVVHPCSTFLDCRQLSTSLNAEVQKTAKIGFFSPPESDRINRSRQILTRKRVLWVGCNTPDVAIIGNRGSVQEPPKSQNLPKIVVFGHWKPTQWTFSDEIWHISVDVRSASGHQIWALSVKGSRYWSPQKFKICPKLWFLAIGRRHNEHIQMKFGL